MKLQLLVSLLPMLSYCLLLSMLLSLLLLSFSLLQLFTAAPEFLPYRAAAVVLVVAAALVLPAIRDLWGSYCYRYCYRYSYCYRYCYRYCYCMQEHFFYITEATFHCMFMSTAHSMMSSNAVTVTKQ